MKYQYLILLAFIPSQIHTSFFPSKKKTLYSTTQSKVKEGVSTEQRYTLGNQLMKKANENIKDNEIKPEFSQKYKTLYPSSTIITEKLRLNNCSNPTTIHFIVSRFATKQLSRKERDKIILELIANHTIPGINDTGSRKLSPRSLERSDSFIKLKQLLSQMLETPLQRG